MCTNLSVCVCVLCSPFTPLCCARPHTVRPPTGTLHSLRSLAHHHLGAVLDELLNAPIPHPPMVVKSFQVIAKDEGLVLPEVNFFTHILNNTQVIEDKVDPKNRRCAPNASVW